ncbi:MAG TPA: RuvX/YqgF family protein [Patescibacteria group bacterium]|nr:RuvX/YqgF family protein [Patescibacteria group bacterium]
MIILGVDWGEKRIGVAIARGNLAEPLGTVGSFSELIRVARDERVERVVLGLPEGKFEERVGDWGKRIKRELGVPVVLRSEVLTSRQVLQKSIEAGKPKGSRRNLDAQAAALLLQEFLDENPSQS